MLEKINIDYPQISINLHVDEIQQRKGFIKRDAFWSKIMKNNPDLMQFWDPNKIKDNAEYYASLEREK